MDEVGDEDLDRDGDKYGDGVEDKDGDGDRYGDGDGNSNRDGLQRQAHEQGWGQEKGWAWA